MMELALFEVIADLHANHPHDTATATFLQELRAELNLPLTSVTLDQLNNVQLPLIFIRSGGTEAMFQAIYERFQEPYLLLTTGRNNSLAASLEILTYLRQQGKWAEILHGTPAHIAERIGQIKRIVQAKQKLTGMRVGVIGQPSDWLIASHVDANQALERLGVQLVDIGIPELSQAIRDVTEVPAHLKDSLPSGCESKVLTGSLRIYLALKALVNKYGLGALTVRCFDLLEPYQNTGCLGLALLNDAGITAGCEGDVSALLSMVVMQSLTDEPVFMANPSEVDVLTNQLIVAHCTVPLTMTESYTLHTHFESNLGIGIRGNISPGRCTVLKLSNDLTSFFVSGGDIIESLERTNLCRTQLRIAIDQDANYFLTRPLGNHHVICRGDHSALLTQFLQGIGLEAVVPK